MSGAWLGAALGIAGGFRAMLRSISVGAIETAIAFLIYGDKVGERPAIVAYQLIFLNFFFFWIIHHFVGVLRDKPYPSASGSPKCSSGEGGSLI